MTGSLYNANNADLGGAPTVELIVKAVEDFPWREQSSVDVLEASAEK